MRAFGIKATHAMLKCKGWAIHCLFIVISLLLLSVPLKATHIVGGEMGYTCLGDNQYEIRLTIYRDCFFGNPDAYFDDPASIGVFDSNNFLLQDIRVELMGDDTLSPVLTDECLVIPPDVCVHTTTYRAVVELLPRPGGYQLAYQRCCRNQTIANIIDPLGTGATYGVTISERALTECNSSATFLQWPPLYICAGEPIFFDQSAIDVDGDSIVYRLCTPLQGANPDIPRPQPPNNPPYAEVVWNDPPYNESNMLNGAPGSDPLVINPQTGLLTGTPNTVGQFVVGICAEEYRDGELISTSRRDFQYNVGVCGQTTAAFFSPDIQCDGLEVFATNQSEGTGNFYWLFGDPNDPLGVSTEEDASFEFPDFGTYTITLIAAAGEVCADTFSQEIDLLPLSLLPDFAIDTISCGDSLVLQLVDLSEDSLSAINSWEWTLNGEVFSTSQEPIITITEAGNYEIGLNLSAANGCQNSLDSALQHISFIDENLAVDSLFLCPGDSVFLNPVFDPQYNFEWSPVSSLSQPNVPNPLAFPDTTTTYQLLLTDANGNCSAERNITVVVPPPLSVSLSPDIVTCEDSILLSATSSTAVRYFWSPFIDFSTAVVADSVFVASPLGLQTYYLQVFDEAGCSIIDSVSVNSLAVNLDLLTPDTAICLGEQILLQIENIDPADELSYNWMPAELVLDGINSATPLVQPAESGITVFSLLTTNQHDCSRSDSIIVTTVDPTQFGANLSYQQCSGRRVDFTAEDPAAALYLWHFGDPLQTDASATGASVSHVYSSAGVFQVMVTLPDYLSCTDTTFLEVTVNEEGTVFPDFSWSYVSCDETATIAISDESTASETVVEAWQWYQDSILVSEDNNYTFNLDSTTMVGINLITMAANGCTDTVSQLITIPLIDLNTTDELLLCPGESAFLNPGGNPAYDYLWTPGTGLSDSTAANPLVMPLSSTNYSLTVSDPASICQRTATVQVNLSPSPTYFLSPDSVTCADELQLFVESDEPLSYTWAADPGFAMPLSSGAFLTVITEPQTYYYLEIVDSGDCRFIDSVLVDGRSVELLLPPEQLVCLADTVSLMASSANEYPISEFSWFHPSAIIGPDNEAEVLIAPQMNTIVGLNVSNAFGCELDTFVRINLLSELPALTVMPMRDTLIPGESVPLFATEQPDYTYEWSPAVGLSNTNSFNPIASPEETTAYQVLIIDENGCENTAEVLLVVFNSPCQAPYIYVPNAFTPNGDSLNDVLRVEGNVIEEFYFAIYDRWGEQVFESFNQNEGWDGTYQGRSLSSDVFGYILEVSCFGGASYITKGNISLIR